MHYNYNLIFFSGLTWINPTYPIEKKDITRSSIRGMIHKVVPPFDS